MIDLAQSLTANETAGLKWVAGSAMLAVVGIVGFVAKLAWGVIVELRDGFRSFEQTLYGPKDDRGTGLVAKVGDMQAAVAESLEQVRGSRATVEMVAVTLSTVSQRQENAAVVFAAHERSDTARFDALDKALEQLPKA